MKAGTLSLLWLLLLACNSKEENSSGRRGDAALDGAQSDELLGVEYNAVALGRSNQGRPIIVERFGHSGPVLLLFHTIHGNEHPSQQLGERMRSQLLLHPELSQGVQILLLTLANPDGWARGSRANAQGVDLNRNFPAANFQASIDYGPSPASEPETQLLVALLEATDPLAIVSVHSPFDFINYDGPAELLAHAAALRSGMAIDLDLGFYPGSFGAWAGQELEIPTLTLELSAELPSLFEHGPGIQVEEAALEYVRSLGEEGPLLSELLDGENEAEDYQLIRLGESVGGRPIVAERLGSRGPPVLVVAGFDGSHSSLFAAERLRALLLSRPVQPLPGAVILLSLASPDSLATVYAQDAPLLALDRSFPVGFEPHSGGGAAPLECVEAALLAQLIEEQRPAALLILRGRDTGFAYGVEGKDESLAAEALEILGESPTRLPSGEPGSLASWAASLSIPSLSLELPKRPFNEGLLRSNRVAAASLAFIYALQSPDEEPWLLCVEDGRCNPGCILDPDCEGCGCDYNDGICEAAFRCNPVTCSCDRDCLRGERHACDPDDHCDSWCPRGLDPDCEGDPDDGKYCE